MQTQIGNITKIINGYPFKSSDFNSDGKGLLIIRIQDMEKGPNNNSKYWEGKYDNNVLIKNGDILVSLSGSFKVEKWEFLEALLNQRIIKIETNNNENLLNGYLYYFLTRKLDEIKSKATNTSIPNISVNDIRDLKIPLPPLSHQKQIIKKLDTLINLINLRKLSIEKTEKLTKSIFIEIFGDENSFHKLGDLATIIMGQSPEGDSYNINGNGEPLLNGPTEFGDIYPLEKQYTTKPKKFSEKGDILFCVRGATAGRLNISDKKYCIGRGLASIRGKKINNEFIYFILKNKYDYFQSIGQGSTFINISKDNLYDLLIPFPTISLQNKFASIVEKNEENIRKQKESLVKLEELYSGIMQESFRI